MTDQELALATPFDFEGHRIRIQDIQGEPWWVLGDVCQAIGLSQPTRAASRLDSGDLTTGKVIDDLGRVQETNLVNESGLYDLIFTSRKPEAKRFKRWVTSDVIPSIRRTGGYIHPEADLPTLLESYAERLREAQRATGKSLMLEAIISDMQPKVIEWDTFMDVKGLVDLGALAQALGGGRQRLIDRMRELGMLVSLGASQGGVRPMQEYAERGWFEVKMKSTAVGRKHETYVTPKGVSGVFRALVKHGVGSRRWDSIPTEAELFERLDFADTP